MANMIITSECKQCIHSIINEEDKARVKIYCKQKDKTYYWVNVFHAIIRRINQRAIYERV